MNSSKYLPVLISGGGIGGLATALALVRQGFRVQVFEQAHEIKEIGAGIQLGPNGFHALDALGVGDEARSRAVFTDYLVMHDAIDESEVAKIETGEVFRKRFDNPYAAIHRADVHDCLLEEVAETGKVEFFTNTKITSIEQSDDVVLANDQNGRVWRGQALIGADGVKSVVRQQFVNDSARVTGHVVYRSVVDKDDFPEELRWNAAGLWAGPNCHLVHYPLRNTEQYNVVVTFHSRRQEEWGVTDGNKDEVQSYFHGVCPKAKQLLDLPKSWKRWATADRDPINSWVFGRVTILGDAAHPSTQYLAQGACMAIEDAVTLGAALHAHNNDWTKSLALYERSRITRTARVVLTAREMGRIYHAAGVERVVRNSLWKQHTQNRFYEALDWLYGWKVNDCLVRIE